MSPIFLRIRKRRRSRGAAMVEGAFLALIFCLFWNLLVYCAGMYLSKIESVQVARAAVFYYASHDCGMSPESDSSAKPDGKFKQPIFNPKIKADRNTAVDTDSDCKDNGGQNSTPTCKQASGDRGSQGFIGHANVETKFTWNWNRPAWWVGAASGQGKTTSDSFVMCNEGPYGINIFSFLGNFIKQIAGSLGF